MANSIYPVDGPSDPSTASTASTSTTSSSPIVVTPTSTTSAPIPQVPPSSDEPERTLSDEPEHPTDSHILANADHEQKGTAQQDHGHIEVRDLGWSEKEREALSRKGQDAGSSKSRIVGGLDNAELWTLVRRFNKQMYHVRALHDPPLGKLDLEIADDEEFSPDKLRANIERLYMTVVVGLTGFWKHIARLRSWREQDRTIAFMSVYVLAWSLDLLIPTIVMFLMVLIIAPRARDCCFPPAPIALIDAKTGGVKNPTAGVLGSDNSLTGAPEKHQGEAVEQEASNFVNSFTAIAISSAAGKDPSPEVQDQDQNHALEEKAPDPTDLAHGLSDAKDKSAGVTPNSTHDKTKEPMSAAMWSKTRPVMHAIADVSDGWERFGNALSPTPPFPQNGPRLKLAGLLLPVFLVSLFVTPYMIEKGVGAVMGFAIFGDPLIWRALTYLNKNFPHWQKLLQVRNTFLRGVPTNAQLTLTLLRIGEANKAPIPPPPSSGPPPPDAPHPRAGENLEHLGVPESELAEAIQSDSTTTAIPESKPPKKRHGRHIISAIKGMTKGGVETLLSADRLKASIGSEHAKNRIGVVTTDLDGIDGPIRFPARYHGQKGHAYITATATTPALSWTTKNDNVEPVWSVGIDEIREIKKIGGLGWKTKVVVGWSLDKGVRDGVSVIDKAGVERKLTALVMREELFNRLVALGSHVWESR